MQIPLARYGSGCDYLFKMQRPRYFVYFAPCICREDAVNEIRILASISHVNIIRYCDAFLERDNLYIVMAFAEHGDVYRQIKKFKAANKYIKEDTIWSYLI